MRVQGVTAVWLTHCDEILNSWFNFGSRYSFSQTHASHASFSASVQSVTFASGQTDGARDSCDQTACCFIDQYMELFSMQQRIQSTHNSIFFPYLTGK